METQRMGKSWRLHRRMAIPVIIRLDCYSFDVTFHCFLKKRCEDGQIAPVDLKNRIAGSFTYKDQAGYLEAGNLVLLLF